MSKALRLLTLTVAVTTMGRLALAAEPRASRKTKLARAASVGAPNEGKLENGVRLDVSKPYLYAIHGHEPGDYLWGLPSLVKMLDRAAKTVNKRFPGSVLSVGDISKKGGGDLFRHHSHESGRDVDVGFYMIDAKGKPLKTRRFAKIDDTLRASTVRGARFDLARNWRLVVEMLKDPAARVSHIFIAEPLRKALLDYGRAHGASRALLDRAALAMMQPKRSLPHDDHFHVRISCPHSSKGGCIEYAKRRTPAKKSRLAGKTKRKKRAAHANAHFVSNDPFELELEHEGEADEAEMELIAD